MNLKIKAFKLLFIGAAMLITTHALAGAWDADVEKTKTYSKSYNVSGGDAITIENKFGETRLETWAGSEVKVDVQIRVKANDEGRAMDLLDGISIEDGKGGGGVYFKTHIDQDNRGNRGRNNKTEMHIDYVVHLPANNTLNLKTEFGDTYMTDYNGPVNITNKFGSLKAGKLSNVKELVVEFGKCEAAAINDGRLTIKYSSFAVSRLSGAIDAKIEFGDGTNITLDEGIKSFTLFNNYSSVKITTSKNISAKFDIETHFGDFKNRTDYNIKSDSDDDSGGPKFDYHYTGITGSGSIPIRVKSNFGTVTLI